MATTATSNSKRCVKGKSCGKSCIMRAKVCQIELAANLAGGLARASEIIGRQNPSPNSDRSTAQVLANGNIVIGGETFMPGKELPGSTRPVLFEDSRGNPAWVVKTGGSGGQNAAEATANKVLGVASRFSEVKGVKTVALPDGRIANKYEKGETLDKLTDREMRMASVSEKVRKGLGINALIANWDFAGMFQDNLMLSGNKLVNIDNGGTFNYRAQGAKKPYGPIPTEIHILRKNQGEPYWAGAKASDYRDIWTKDVRGLVQNRAALERAVSASDLTPEVKQSFKDRLTSFATVDSTLRRAYGDNATVDWTKVDGAIGKAFTKTNQALGSGSQGFETILQQNLNQELGALSN